MNIRLDHFLAENNFGTRKHVKKLIKDGLVKIDDKPCFTPDFKFNPEETKIYVNEKLVPYQKELYLLLNKPAGYLCSTIDELYPSVLNLLEPSMKKRARLVGRLDVDTTGVLLITDNGKLNNKLIHPNTKIEKEYKVTVNHEVTNRELEILRGKIDLFDDGIVQAKRVEQIGKDTILITILEGKYHEIKRMCKRADLEVMALDRIRLGSLTYGNLKPGEYRSLNENEIKNLKSLVGIKEDVF